MKDEPPAKRRIRLGKLWWWIVAVFAALIGWQMWELHLYNAAVREAKEAGLKWESSEPFDEVTKDWRAAFRLDTWTSDVRRIGFASRDLGPYRDLLLRLRPTSIDVSWCRNLDALKGLTSLRSFHSYPCCVQNLDALAGLKRLRYLTLIHCSDLQNIDAIKGSTDLQLLTLTHCPALQNVDSLKNLTGLTRLELAGCRSLENIEALKGLKHLKTLDLTGSKCIPTAALRELRAALPNTDITFPDGTKNPPQ